MLSIQKNRYHQLRKLIAQAYELITEYENNLLVSQSPKEKLKFKCELEDTRQYLKEFKAEMCELEVEIKTSMTDTLHLYMDSVDQSISSSYFSSLGTITHLMPRSLDLDRIA
jgi:hypothetical protein